jgi:hypothetical protein
VAAGDSRWPVNFGRISFLMRRKQDNLATAMLSTCGCSFKNVVGACLLSSVVAGVICALTDRVVASNASTIVATVERTNKGDRMGIAQRVEYNPTPTKKIVFTNKPPIGCETAFSPFADPGRPNVLNYCRT